MICINETQKITKEDINEQARIAFEKCKETREQKIERLKKEYWILAEMINERFEKAIKIEERIRHLREIQIKVGDMYCHTDKSLPNTIQIAETELEEVNKQRLRLFDEKLKLEQKIKELEDDTRN